MKLQLIVNYLKDIFGHWITIVFFLVDLVVIVVGVAFPTVSISTWVYWIIALTGFILANIVLYAKQFEKIQKYEIEESNLILHAKDLHIGMGEVLQVFDGRPMDGLDDYFMPISPYLTASLEIENLGRETGVFVWEIIKIELGNIFTFDSAVKNGFISRPGENWNNQREIEVQGRSRYSGIWKLPIDPSKSNIVDFSDLLKDPPARFLVVMQYWTKRIGGMSNETIVELSLPISDFIDAISEKWIKRDSPFLAEKVRNRKNLPG